MVDMRISKKFVVFVVVVFAIYHYFYRTTSPVHPQTASWLFIPEIQIMWSIIVVVTQYVVRQRNTKVARESI